MKYSNQIFLLTTGLLILMVMREPVSYQNMPSNHKQMMEDTSTSARRFRIRYEILNPKESPVADILWLKKVARFTLKKGFNGFNILEEIIKPHSVEGIIELEADRMKADYDSYEILDLELPKCE